MNDEMTAFAAEWARLWAERGAAPTVADPLALGDTPAYPLARTVELPEGHACPTGALSFRLAGLELHGLARLDAARPETPAEPHRVRLRLALEPLTLRGRYSVDAKPDPILNLDTAGDLMDLPPEACRPTAAGSEADDPALDPEREEWLNHARAQRDELATKNNGGQLIGAYYEHNEVYDQLFKESQSMRDTWQAGGVTKAMAADTHQAVGANEKINDKQYTAEDGTQVSYNGNAFTQQLAVVMNTVMLDPNFDPFDPGPPPEGKYLEASKAALGFGKTVKGSTNNDKRNVNPLNRDEVYATVETHPGDPPVVTSDEVANVVGTGADTGGADEGGDLGWTTLDEDDRALLRRLYQAGLKERAERGDVKGRPLFEGDVEARIEGAEAVVELTPEEGEGGEGGKELRAVSVEVVLPAFEFDIDDANWTGEAAGVARRRLERMYFLHSLIHDAVVEGLKKALGRAASGAYAGSLGRA